MSVRKVFHFLYRHYKTLQWSYPLDFLKTCTLWSPFLSEKTVQSLSLLLSHKLMQPDLADLLETLSSLYPALAPLVPLKIFGREFLTTHKNTYIEDVTWPRGDTNFSSSVSVCLNTRQGFWYFARSRSREIQVNPRNPPKFGKNLNKYMSVQHIWNLFQLLGLFTCCKRANVSWNFVTETCKQRPETTRRQLCCEKLGSGHDVLRLCHWLISWAYCCWKSKW